MKVDAACERDTQAGGLGEAVNSAGDYYRHFADNPDGDLFFIVSDGGKTDKLHDDNWRPMHEGGDDADG